MLFGKKDFNETNTRTKKTGQLLASDCFPFYTQILFKKHG